MFRKLMLGEVAVVAIGFGAQEATAHEPAFGPIGGRGAEFHPPRTDYDYVVFVRRGPHHHWERYGRFETFYEARRAERRLEHGGFEVFIKEVRDSGRRW